MLSPEWLDEAADMVAATYQQIEAEMLDVLVRAMLSADLGSQRARTALLLLAQSASPRLEAILEEHAGEIDARVREAVEEALEANARSDCERLGVEFSAPLPAQVASTARGIAEVLARDNLDMVEAARRLFVEQSAWAVTQANTGAMTADRAAREAVRRMERRGLTLVSYRDPSSGEPTVSNAADVAVRRHVRTQVAQDGARDTMERMSALGSTLVEVTSHAGARPSHAAWQGRVYSLSGTQVIDGVTYPDLRSATGYGTVTGLCGANCRHSFGPYRHGAKRLYGPDPGHPSGLSGARVYELQQGQRQRERAIRQAKRELRGARAVLDADGSLASVAEYEKARRLLSSRQAAMRDYIREANAESKARGVEVLRRRPAREWAGDMPGTPPTGASMRTLSEFMESAATARTLASRGASKASARRAIVAELEAQGAAARDFTALTRSEQRAMLRRAVPSAHAAERMEERGVSREQVDDALARPIHRDPVREDAQGRRSQRLVGREATVVVNPDTGRIITTYRTGSRERRRYGAE